MNTPFTIPCAHCSVKLSIKKESLIGRRIACPKCGKAIEVKAPALHIPAEDDDFEFNVGLGHLDSGVFPSAEDV